MRETSLILLYQVNKWKKAKELIFKEPIIDNLDRALFDFVIVGSVSKYAYKQMNNPLYSNEMDDSTYSPKSEYKDQLADCFNTIKQNLYKLVEENAKRVFVQVFNQSVFPSTICQNTCLMMKLLNIIPKDLRIFIREGVIFSNMKTIKSLWRKSCKDTVNYAKYRIKSSSKNFEKYSKIFMHLPVLLKIISKCAEKYQLPLSSESALD